MSKTTSLRDVIGAIQPNKPRVLPKKQSFIPPPQASHSQGNLTQGDLPQGESTQGKQTQGNAPYGQQGHTPCTKQGNLPQVEVGQTTPPQAASSKRNDSEIPSPKNLKKESKKESLSCGIEFPKDMQAR